MRSFNFIGRLVRDPEAKMVGEKNFVEFSIAVDGAGPRDHDTNKTLGGYFDCTAWGGCSEFISKYFHKGKPIAISGNIVQERWKDKETGQNRSAVRFVVNSAGFVPQDSSDKANVSEEVLAGVGADKPFNPFED